MIKSHALGPISGLLGASVVVGGVAIAAIPSSSGVLTACVKKETGVIRMIDAEAGKKCGAGAKRERPCGTAGSDQVLPSRR